MPENEPAWGYTVGERAFRSSSPHISYVVLAKGCLKMCFRIQSFSYCSLCMTSVLCVLRTSQVLHVLMAVPERECHDGIPEVGLVDEIVLDVLSVAVGVNSGKHEVAPQWLTVNSGLEHLMHSSCESCQFAY